MLQELTIRNFAIIEDLNIHFAPGLTILSGETGAGKSIIINAVNLLLGGRASAALIRTGAESAELEALFDIPADSSVAQRMTDAGYDTAEGLLVRRIISNQDRHRIYINGRLATMQLLADLTARLASIAGQHAHQGLLKEEEHLFILDQFGDLLSLRARYGESHAQVLPLIRQEQSLCERQRRQDEQVELLRFQQQEIEAAAPQPDEEPPLMRVGSSGLRQTPSWAFSPVKS
jgi:DNA repair protein RecN (Recombination protein N)